LSGKRVGFFSYGSGMCAEFFSGTVLPGAQDRVRAPELFSLLERRKPLSISAYEELMRAREEFDTRPATTEGTGYLGVRDHRRVYGK
jgi:hydroxymethylglutaryl-CoA synthase